MAYWEPAYLKDMVAYIKDPSVYMYGRWDNPASANEGGVDLASPGGTPVYALADGTIVGIGNFWHSASIYTPNSGPPGYGVITTRVNIPGYGSNDLYYQHIQIASGLKNGQTVKRGQQIGTITNGVNEIEMGLNADWGGIWGTNHPAAWATDPRPQIKALMALGDPGKANSSSSGVPLTRGHFINEVLLNLAGNFGYTPSLNITNFMISWTHLVGGSFSNACAFNLLNATQDEPGAKQCADGLPGVKSYPDAATGLKAMVDALQSGHYPNLVHALTTNDETNLGFTRRGAPSFANMMANNIAQELSFWATGKRTPLAQNYILKIMAGAGISNASIEGGTANGGPASGPGKWGDDQMPGLASDVQPPGNPVDPNSIQGLVNGLSNLNNFFGNLNALFTDPVRLVKIIGGAALVIGGLALLVRSFTPGVSKFIGGKASGK